jgi:hypothetical protein
MKSAASVDGRTLTGAYRTRPSVYGCGCPYSTASQLNRCRRFRCLVLVPPWLCDAR